MMLPLFIKEDFMDRTTVRNIERPVIEPLEAFGQSAVGGFNDLVLFQII